MDQGSHGSLTLDSPSSQTNVARHSQKDKENPRTVQGSPQVTEKLPTIVNAEDLGTDDVVIAVMGSTGSGKTTFVHSASGYDTQEVDHTLKSRTSEVLCIRFWAQKSGRYVVLVDTPEFDDTDTSDCDIFGMISRWLDSSRKERKLLSGILYLHRITDNRMAGTPLKSFRGFQRLCGKDALAMVYLTTTMWDEVEPKVGERRLNELKKDYWKGMITHGAQVARCRSDDDSSKDLIRHILAQEHYKK